MISLNGKTIEFTLFPDNASQVWKIPEDEFLTNSFVKWDFHHEGEFIRLAQLKDLLDSKACRVSLEITYLPYGRQDKEISNNTTFGLYTFARLLNSLNFDKVSIIDPHSSVALELIRKSKAFYPIEDVNRLVEDLNIDLLCYPDNGARFKYRPIYKHNHIYGHKIRDQLTGHITNYSVVGEVKDKKILIVDDICDGGATFLLLTKDLLVLGAKEVHLFVTHGIFSKGRKVLLNSGIKTINCYSNIKET